MDLLSIRLWLRAVDLGGVGVAARDLGLSAAAASVRLNKLEADVGARLLTRTTRAIALTTDGAAFLPYARAALESLDFGRAAAAGGGAEPAGTLRIAMPGSFGRMHVVPALAAFSDRYPKIQLDLRLSDEIIDVVAGAFDLVLRNAALADSSMIARKLASDRRILVASPAYIARRGAPETPRDLRRHAAIILGDKDRWSFADNGASIAVDGLRVNDGEAARIAAEAGMGVALKSLWNAREALDAGRLVQVLPDYPLATEEAIWALYPASHVPAPKLRAMIDFLVARFEPLPPWER